MAPEQKQPTAPVQPRPNPEEYNMALAVEVASRSNCMKSHVGAIFVFGGRIRATGYNGTVEGYQDCFEGGCPRCSDPSIHRGEQLDRCICVHAEENALVSAARHGIELEGSECYVTHEPCVSCTKLLIQSHVIRVIYLLDYEYPGLDRNDTRKKMRDHSRQNNGPLFQRFDQAVNGAADSQALARQRAKEWGERLKRMKEAAEAYAENYQKFKTKQGA